MTLELNNTSTTLTRHTPTHEELEFRRNRLEEILHEAWDRRENPTTGELVIKMQEHFPTYDRFNLAKDRLAVQARDNFVSELSIFSYSAMMRDIFNKIEYVENESQKDFDDSKGFVRINSKKIYLECQKLKANILEGKVMDISVELLGKKLRSMQEENTKLRAMEDKSQDKSPPVK